MLSSSYNPLVIGIIGLGPFAQFLAKTLIKQGHTITATSRSDYSDLCSDLGIKFFRESEQFFEAQNDVILVSTSIVSLSDVVGTIPFHKLRQKTLFVDVLSVKEYPKDLFLQVLPEECDLLCTHPIFGPESGRDGWRDLGLVYDKVRIRNGEVCRDFLGIFEREGCKMVELTCKEHDQLAARSQFLAHTIGRILSEMNVESTLIDTNGYQTLLKLKESSMKDSYDLYCGLFKHNKFAKQELEKLELAFQTVKKKLLETEDDI